MNQVVSFLSSQNLSQGVKTCHHTSGLNCTSLLTPTVALITDQSTSIGGVNIKLHSSSGDHKGVKSIFCINTNPLQVNLHLS